LGAKYRLWQEGQAVAGGCQVDQGGDVCTVVVQGGAESLGGGMAADFG
jgi:hypothetical protein